MKSLTYVEIDLEICALTYGVAPCEASIPETGSIKCFNSIKTCQDRENYEPRTVTLRFAQPTEYLPREIEAIPSISEVSLSPATISLGENLGQRATLTVKFEDHRDADVGDGRDPYYAERDYNPWERGTFWGKFRARHPFLRGCALRLVTGTLGQALGDMETRHYVVDSFDGPTPDGTYSLIAKDVLKLADGDRAQAPVMNTGYLTADIDAAAVSCSLSPVGIGDAEYPASGLAVLGGNEIVSFTRTGDALTIARAQLGTAASSHRAQDRVQLVLSYTAQDVADILNDLFVNYAGVPAEFIPLSDWRVETAAFLGRLYTAHVCEPTAVDVLASELILQACLSVWWDDVAQKVRLRVLRGIPTSAARFTPENTIEGSLTTKEQPDKRVSQVWVYFGQINPVKQLSDTDNYRSVAVVTDVDAEDDYGAPAIRKIFSRWIPALGRVVADRVGAIHIGRYRDPPRRVTFALQRYAQTDPELGAGYRVEADCVQDETGAPSDIPIQITRLNPGPANFRVEAEEMLFTTSGEDFNNRKIVIDANAFNVDLRAAHDLLYPAPTAGITVTCIINAGVVVGSTSIAAFAFNVGMWPAGVDVVLDIRGRIQGRGGDGGYGGGWNGEPGAGQPGGGALYARNPVKIKTATGKIFGGAGGGGGGRHGNTTGFVHPGGGGGGGAGSSPGAGAGPGVGSETGVAYPGGNGTPDAGGTGGGTNGSGLSGNGGNGGGPGQPGSVGGSGNITGFIFPGGPGGAAGAAIDGASHVTIEEGPGDIRGPQIN